MVCARARATLNKYKRARIIETGPIGRPSSGALIRSSQEFAAMSDDLRTGDSVLKQKMYRIGTFRPPSKRKVKISWAGSYDRFPG